MRGCIMVLSIHSKPAKAAFIENGVRSQGRGGYAPGGPLNAGSLIKSLRLVVDLQPVQKRGN